MRTRFTILIGLVLALALVATAAAIILGLVLLPMAALWMMVLADRGPRPVTWSLLAAVPSSTCRPWSRCRGRRTILPTPPRRAASSP